jgi:transposase-like protein
MGIRLHTGNTSMSTKIPLPKITQEDDTQAHMYPFQISLQTQEFLQAAIFYTAFTDIATSEHIRIDGKLEEIESIFTERLYTKEAYDECWEFMQCYFEIFRKGAFQNVIVSLNSHWDWYIRNLGRFIEFAREHVESPALNSSQRNDLSRIGNCSISQQLETIEIATGVQLELDERDKEYLNEMSRVRNIGLHNRWEVDEKYIELSGRSDVETGDIRFVEIDEINLWHDSLIKTLVETCRKTAISYVAAPAYP